MKMLRYIIIIYAIFQVSGLLYSQVTQDWVARFDGSGHDYDRVYSMAVDIAGNVYVTGSSEGNGSGQDYITIKYNSNGVVQWMATYNGPANHHDQAYSIYVDISGNVYVTGGSFSVNTERDYCTIKYSPDGDEIWVRRYDGPGGDIDEAISVAVDLSGNVFVSGYSDDGINMNYHTIKYDSSGSVIWSATYNFPVGGTGSEDRPHDMTIDYAGNVYITGESNTGFGFLDMYATIKYNSAGIQQWEARYKAEGDSGLSQANSIAVDDSGNVYVTGRSDPSSAFGFNFDILTIKYDIAGDSLWVRRYNGPADNSDIGAAIALDNSGNILVTGSSFSGTSADFILIKYGPSGDTIWISGYNGTANSVDVASSLFVDDFDNIYVTGFSTGIGSLRDYVLVKFNSAGILQWEQRYNGPGNNNDEPISVIADNSGNIYVTGSSTGIGSGFDYATIKFTEEIVPVELISFTAGNTGTNVILQWHTGSETNNSGFEIQRSFSADGNQNNKWDIIGFVEGKGTTNQKSFYTFSDNSLPVGKYHYRLKQFDFDGTFEYSDIISVDIRFPFEFMLGQNHPNPFNPDTRIQYTIGSRQYVTLKIYDLLGREVAALVNDEKPAGKYEVIWNTSSQSSGVYFYRLQSAGFIQTRKMILLK